MFSHGCDRIDGPGRWIGSFRFATAALYIALNVGLVELHANEEFYPHSTRAWADATQERDHGHNHVLCQVFWSSVPSPASRLLSPQIHHGNPVPLEPEANTPPLLSHRRKGPLPRGPPLVA